MRVAHDGREQRKRGEPIATTIRISRVIVLVMVKKWLSPLAVQAY
jgi:hypothetical protein